MPTNPYQMMTTALGVMNSCFEVFNTDMPLRNFTMRLFARLIFKMKPMLSYISEDSPTLKNASLTLQQRATMMEALKRHSAALKKLVMLNVPEQGFKIYDPEYRLYESFMEHLTDFNPPETAL